MEDLLIEFRQFAMRGNVVELSREAKLLVEIRTNFVGAGDEFLTGGCDVRIAHYPHIGCAVLELSLLRREPCVARFLRLCVRKNCANAHAARAC